MEYFFKTEFLKFGKQNDWGIDESSLATLLEPITFRYVVLIDCNSIRLFKELMELNLLNLNNPFRLQQFQHYVNYLIEICNYIVSDMEAFEIKINFRYTNSNQETFRQEIILNGK